jgi:hypothetical protein
MNDSFLIAILSIPSGIPSELFALLVVYAMDEQMTFLDSIEKLSNGNYRLPEGWTKDVL